MHKWFPGLPLTQAEMCVTLPLNCKTADVDASGKILCTECDGAFFLSNY